MHNVVGGVVGGLFRRWLVQPQDSWKHPYGSL